MEPTMLVGDWLFVNKIRFGPHIPFTNFSLPGYAQPKRGDIAVFESPPQDESIRITPDEYANAPQAIFTWQHQIEIQGTRFGAPVVNPTLHEWGPLVVPSGHYFMKGDNRDDSVDSRFLGIASRRNYGLFPYAFTYLSNPFSAAPQAGLMTHSPTLTPNFRQALVASYQFTSTMSAPVQTSQRTSSSDYRALFTPNAIGSSL